MTDVDRLLAEAMKLTVEERTQLAERLLEVVPDGAEIEAAWMAEAQRRFADHDASRSQSVPWSEARERIFAKP